MKFKFQKLMLACRFLRRPADSYTGLQDRAHEYIQVHTALDGSGKAHKIQPLPYIWTVYRNMGKPVYRKPILVFRTLLGPQDGPGIAPYVSYKYPIYRPETCKGSI